MNDEQLLRYSRQIMLPQLDVAGQEKLLAARVLIIGLGGLGCPVGLYLAAAGVGQLTLADDDEVELSNLQRQIAHTRARIGMRKVESASTLLRELNGDLEIGTLPVRLKDDSLRQAVAGADVVVDATDNFTTRFAINRCCVESGVPLVSGAAIRFEGQVSVFDPRDPASPCYGCLYEEDDGAALNLNCSENGVISPLVGIIGSIQAMETVKLISGMGQSLAGRLLLVDALSMQFREMRLDRNPDCRVCR